MPRTDSARSRNNGQGSSGDLEWFSFHVTVLLWPHTASRIGTNSTDRGTAHLISPAACSSGAAQEPALVNSPRWRASGFCVPAMERALRPATAAGRPPVRQRPPAPRPPLPRRTLGPRSPTPRYDNGPRRMSVTGRSTVCEGFPIAGRVACRGWASRGFGSEVPRVSRLTPRCRDLAAETAERYLRARPHVGWLIHQLGVLSGDWRQRDRPL